MYLNGFRLVLLQHNRDNPDGDGDKDPNF
jgi:hypothetical protein